MDTIFSYQLIALLCTKSPLSCVHCITLCDCVSCFMFYQCDVIFLFSFILLFFYTDMFTDICIQCASVICLNKDYYYMSNISNVFLRCLQRKFLEYLFSRNQSSTGTKVRVYLPLCPSQILHFSTVQINCTEEKLVTT